MPPVQRLIGRVEQQAAFPEVDPDKSANVLDISYCAASAGQSHVMPTATLLDSHEVAIEGYHRDIAGEGRHRAEIMIGAAEVRGEMLVGMPEPDFANAGELAEQALDKHKTDSAPGIINTGRDLANADHEKNVFKNTHRLHHEPRRPVPSMAVLLGTASFIAIEACCNMNALAAGLPGGLVDGWLTAASLAAANVGAGFGAGFAAREILHARRWRRILGGIAIGAYLLLLAHWAALLGYYREMLLGEHPEAAGKLAVQALRTYGVTGPVFSVQGAVLIGVTIGFGLLALGSVFAIREPYPGYARLGQRLANARTALDKMQTDYRVGIDLAVQPILAAVSSQADEWTQSRAALRQHIADVKAVIGGYRRFWERVQYSVDQVCSRYRLLLGKFSDRPIARYAGAYDLGQPLNPGPIVAMIGRWEKVLPDAAAVAAFEKKVAAAQAAIRTAAAKAHNTAKSFFDECAKRAQGYIDGSDSPPAPPLRLPAPELVA